jgi:hypothetical protein
MVCLGTYDPLESRLEAFRGNDPTNGARYYRWP